MPRRASSPKRFPGTFTVGNYLDIIIAKFNSMAAAPGEA
jgi:hypothetical protein